MARTKQTARKSMKPKTPRHALATGTRMKQKDENSDSNKSSDSESSSGEPRRRWEASSSEESSEEESSKEESSREEAIREEYRKRSREDSDKESKEEAGHGMVVVKVDAKPDTKPRKMTKKEAEHMKAVEAEKRRQKFILEAEKAQNKPFDREAAERRKQCALAIYKEDQSKAFQRLNNSMPDEMQEKHNKAREDSIKREMEASLSQEEHGSTEPEKMMEVLEETAILGLCNMSVP
jgi:hypothetical protein